MLFPAKQRICLSVHPDLCLATIPSGGRSGGWDSSIWEERTTSGARVGTHRRRVLATQKGRWQETLPKAAPRLGLLHQSHVPYARVECTAELCGVTHKTAFEWRHRVFATVSGYQDRIVLRDTVWVDETYINDTDLSKGYGQVRKRGLSLQKLSICAPSTSTRTRSRSSAATGSPARRA